MRNKGQTAMEYLMTYGWAILIVIVVVAALFAMGVFKIGAGTKCSPCFPAGGDFTFQDHNGIDIVIKVGPRDIRVPDATGTLWAATTTQTVSGGVQAYADPNTQDCATNTAWTGDCQVILHYYVEDTQLTHTASATLHQ